jgi:hypothetical protein
MAYVGKVPLTGAYQILDDISSGFNGSTATFNLTTSGTAVSPETEASVIISVSGVVQQPISAFTISGSQITFTGNPASSDTFFGIVLGNTFDIGKPTDATVGAASLSTDFRYRIRKHNINVGWNECNNHCTRFINYSDRF